MSMDLFLVCIEGSEKTTFKRALAQKILGRDALRPELALTYRVDYPDGSGAEVSCDEGEDLDNISFSRFGGEMFFVRLWELADHIEGLIFWPAPGPNKAATRVELLDRLPSEWREDEDDIPVVVHSGREIFDAIEESFPPLDAPDGGAEE